MSIVHVGASTLDQEFKDADERLVVLEFFADWCEPCKAIGPKIESMSEEFADVKFLRIDTEKDSAITDQYFVSGIPVFVLFRNSKEVARVTGAVEGVLRETILRHK